MKTFLIKIPICGYLEKEVEAIDEQTAINIVKSEATIDDIVEWDSYDYIVKGNVFYGSLNEIEVEEYEEENDIDE